MSAKIIGVLNHKGGVGKTTTVCALASLFEMVGKRVLLVDADPQGNSSQIFRVLNSKDNTNAYEAYNLFLGTTPVKDLILTCPDSNVKVIASGPMHKNTATDLAQLAKEEGTDAVRIRLKNRLEEVKDDFDFIIIDNNPARDFIAENVLTASDYILTPVEMDGFGYEGLKTVLDDIMTIKKTLNPKLNFLGVLFTRVEPRTNIFADLYPRFIQDLGDDVIKQPIRKDKIVKEANTTFTPLYRYVARSKGGTDYIHAAQEMGLITEEEMERLLGWHGMKKDNFDWRAGVGNGEKKTV